MTETKKMYDKPARYRVLERSYLPDPDHEYSRPNDPITRIYEPGEEVSYCGHPGSALEPLDAEGKRRKDHYLKAKGVTAAELIHRKNILTKGAGDTEGVLDIPTGPALDRVKPAPPVALADDEPTPVSPGQAGNPNVHRRS